MKTTVDLEDGLLIRAKKRAAELRVPLRQLIEQGLRRELEKAAPAKTLHLHTVKGAVEIDVTSRDRMGEWIDKT